MAQKARDIMTSNPQTCSLDDTVLDAVKVMDRQNTGIVPIVDEQDCAVGVITDRDIALRVVLDRMDPVDCHLQDVMTKDLVCCSPDDDLDHVINHMEESKVRRVLIADEQDHILGIISEGDIARGLGKERAGDLVQSVTQPGGPHET